MKNLALLAILAISNIYFGQNSTVNAFEKSYTYEYQAKYTKAIEVIENACSETSYSANLRLGWLYYLNSDLIKSKVFYNKAIKSNPNSIEAKQGLVYPLKAMNNWDEVITVYKSILGVDANNTASHYQLAYIYSVRKDYNASVIHLKSVLKLRPFDYDSNALLGYVYVKMGKIKEAKFHYTRALEYAPSSVEIKKVLEGL